jgi:hypothetical protein
MIAVPQVAEFVDDGVFQHSLRGEDQVPVQVYHPVEAATAPEVLLVLDLGLGQFPRLVGVTI